MPDINTEFWGVKKFSGNELYLVFKLKNQSKTIDKLRIKLISQNYQRHSGKWFNQC